MRHLLPLVALLLPALHAQTATPVDPPHLVIDTVGPDGWRMRLGPTNLGSLLESEQGRELWRPFVEPIEATWHRVLGDEASYSASRARMLGYGGRIRVALWLDGDGDPTDAESSFVVVCDGDGRTDLEALAADLRQTIYQNVAGEWRDAEVGDAKLQVRATQNGTVTAPMTVDGRVVIAGANDDDLARAMRRARALAAGSTPLRPDSPAMTIRFDFEAIVARAFAAAAERLQTTMKAVGLPSLGDGILTVGTAGPRVAVEFAQHFRSDERGLFAAVLPSTPTVPTLLSAIAADATWTLGHFDLLQFYESVMRIIDTERNGENTRKEIREEVGLDPATDVLAHMTDEVLITMPDGEDMFEHAERTPWLLTWRLRDDEAFKTGLLRLLPHLKPFFTRETAEQHGDIELFRYGNMLSYDVWLTVGNGVFVIGGGRDVDEHIKAMLDRCAGLPSAPAAEPALPEGFASLKRHLPPGAHGFALGNAANVARLPTWMWTEILADYLPLVPHGAATTDPDEDTERGEELAKLLEHHNLNIARSSTGYAERTWRWRFYW